MMTATVQFIDVATNQGSFGSFDVPGAGGSRRVKIAENDSPLPQDRVFFMYNHFHNVYEFQENQFLPGPQTFQRQQPIDRYTFGLEKTFLDGDWSVELRLPLNGSLDAEGNLFAVRGGQYGNLAVIVKRLLYDDDLLAIGAGIGIDTPTGSQAQAEIGQNVLTFENESVHVLPYLGLVWSPADSLFVTGFLQVDVSTSGSDVVFTEQGLTPQPAGRFNEQNLLFADVGVGYWLYQNPYAEWLTGVAALLEFHYTTALQDTDSVLVERGSLAALISNPVNRFDVVNVSAGVNIDIGETANLRVAGVFPLGDAADNRFFDSEVQVQFNQRF